jgi:hypothetical protein
MKLQSKPFHLQHLQQQQKVMRKEKLKRERVKKKKQNQRSKKAKSGEDIHVIHFQLQASMFVKLEKLQVHW